MRKVAEREGFPSPFGLRTSSLLGGGWGLDRAGSVSLGGRIHHPKIKSPDKGLYMRKVAEREGFEPSVEFYAPHSLSSWTD